MSAESSLNRSPFLLRLLGPPQIEGPDGLLEGGVVHRHRLALLAVLAVAPRGLVSRDRLMGQLWPEASPESARNLLNAALHAVRRAMGEDVLVSQGANVLLDRSTITIDVVEFENAVASGESGRAIELYVGPFLDGLSLPGAVEFEHWLDGERDRLERLFHAALEQHAETVARNHGHASAVPLWRRRLACSPMDGRVVVQLMRALEASGDRAGALQAAGVHESLLRAELGIPANPEVVALAARLLSHPTANSGNHAKTLSVADAEDNPMRGELGKHADADVMPVGEQDRQAPSDDLKSAARSKPSIAGSRRRHLVLALTVMIAAVAGYTTFSGTTNSGRATAPAPPKGWPLALPTITDSVVRQGDVREMYSKGEFLLGDVSPRAEAALAYFLAAIARDSTFAQAYLGVARSYVSMGLHGRVPPSEVRLEARAAAQRALALDNKLTDAYAVLGTLSLLYDWDWDAAAREFARLSENQLVHGTLVLYRIILGDSLEAIQMARQVVESDALSPQKNLTMAWALWMVGRCDDAVQRLLELRGLYPQYAWAHVELAWNYVCLGDYPNAAAAADEAEKLVASEENLRASLAYVYAKVGRSGDARRILRELEEIGKERYIDQGKLVAAYAALGDTTMALNALEAAFAAGSPELAFLRAAPADFYDTIRSHQRFIEVVKRLRFPRRNRAASETDPE